MKYELWYKPAQAYLDAYESGTSLEKLCKIHAGVEIYAANERPGTQSKSGYHLVATENDLPKQSAPEVSETSLNFPRTLLELRNRKCSVDMSHLEKVAGQLLVSGSVQNWRCLFLLQRSTELAQAFDRLRQELVGIPDDKLRLADEAITGKK